MNKEELLKFLLKARTKTYARATGKVESVFKGSKQLEHREDDWFYRDIYYTGNGIFMGVEVVCFKNNPIWAMSYYGDFGKMAEEEIDKILRKALIENWQKARTWHNVEWTFENYKYICTPDFPSSIEKLAGAEKILKNNKEIYLFFYAGGLLI